MGVNIPPTGGTPPVTTPPNGGPTKPAGPDTPVFVIPDDGKAPPSGGPVQQTPPNGGPVTQVAQKPIQHSHTPPAFSDPSWTWDIHAGVPHPTAPAGGGAVAGANSGCDMMMKPAATTTAAAHTAHASYVPTTTVTLTGDAKIVETKGGGPVQAPGRATDVAAVRRAQVLQELQAIIQALTQLLAQLNATTATPATTPTTNHDDMDMPPTSTPPATGSTPA